MFSPLTKALALTAGIVGALYYVRKPSRFRGDDARVGDVADVATATVPAGALPALIPAGAGFIGVQVSDAAPDTLSGMITSYVISETPLQRVMLPQAIGPVIVQRKDVGAVYRNGAKVS